MSISEKQKIFILHNAKYKSIRNLESQGTSFIVKGDVNFHIQYIRQLVDPGKARGCSTNTAVINFNINTVLTNIA